MLLSRGDSTVFVTRPISLGLLIVAAAPHAAGDCAGDPRKREEAFQES